MGCILKMAGMDFLILEKGSQVGGTWNYNKFPGAATDAKCAGYSFTFYEFKDWKRVYPYRKRIKYRNKIHFTWIKWLDHVIKAWFWCILRDEILSYIYSVVDHFDIGTHFKFNSGMKSATWDETTSSWNVETESGIVYNGKFLINCMGFLYKELSTTYLYFITYIISVISFKPYYITYSVYGDQIKAKLSKTERNWFIQRKVISLCSMGRRFWLHRQESCRYRKWLYCYPRNLCFLVLSS